MKKITLLAYMILFTLVSQTTLHAQQVNSELKNLIDQAFTYFPKLKEAEQSVIAAEEKTDLLKTGYIPTLNATATYNYIAPVGQATFPTGPSSSQTIQFQPNNNFNGGLSLNYMVYDFGRLQSTILKSKQELLLTKDNIELQKTQLAAQVCQYYYGMVFLKKSLSIQDSLIEVFKENLRLAQSRLKNGAALQLDVLNIQSALDQEEMKRTDILNNYNKQVIFLEYMTGIAKVSISGEAFDYEVVTAPVNTYVTQAKSSNYEFSIAGKRLDILKTDLKFNHSQYLPYLNINGNAGFRNGYQPDINEIRFNYAFGAGVTIPIFDAFRTKSQTKITKTLITQQEIQIDGLEKTYTKDISLVMADLETSKEKLTKMTSLIEAGKEALRIAHVQHNNGISTYLDLVNAAYTLEKFQLQKAQIEYTICLSNIELARLSGVKFY